ncbi:hypothetical protein ACQ4LE_010450 [Meloidogyne hapla]
MNLFNHFSPPILIFLFLLLVFKNEANTSIRIILASNAPPFHLELSDKLNPERKSFKSRVANKLSFLNKIFKKSSKEKWLIKQSSGGLVTAVEPVMEKSEKNIWVFHFTHSDKNLEQNSKKDPKLLAIENYKPKTFNFFNKSANPRSKFGLSPVIIGKDEFDEFYKGMSNNILWPAFHDILDKIVVTDFSKSLKGKFYKSEFLWKIYGKLIQFTAYNEVNKKFAQTIFDLKRTENDFVWIQDYHLLFVGKHLREMEKERNKKLNKKQMNLGFFLHTPFALSEEFLAFKIKTEEICFDFSKEFTKLTKKIIKGILSFNKVGFQTNNDRKNFIKLTAKFHGSVIVTVENNKRLTLEEITNGEIKNIINLKISDITPDGGCNLGVYPATIKIEDFTTIANDDEIIEEAKELRKEKMKNTLEGGKLFFGVERFDYTKGIKEKLLAFEKYLENNIDRIGKDVLYQIAQNNRGGIGSFKDYQEGIKDLPDEINERVRDLAYKNSKIILTNYKPIIFVREGVNREELIKHYLAMDIGVVTPVMDGMNLVAKEMIVCKPEATLILSKGAGIHHQFLENKLHDNYYLVEKITDVNAFAAVMHKAATEPKEVSVLSKYLEDNGVEKWSEEFLYGKNKV